MSNKNPLYIRIEKTSEHSHIMKVGEMHRNGEICYTDVTDGALANHIDQQLQFAVGVDLEDIIQNGEMTPYVNLLLKSFNRIKIEME